MITGEQQADKWISRNDADRIHNAIINEAGTIVYLIEAPAGSGKTIIARDIGTRLGSATGYEPSPKDRDVMWSGILDMYDQDTNSNRGMEMRLMSAFAKDDADFEKYLTARHDYEMQSKKGSLGIESERQRRNVEMAFAEGLQTVTSKGRIVIAIDTVERLESASDLVPEDRPDYGDTTSLPGWLIYQVSQLRNAVVLLLGRKSKGFYAALKRRIDDANDGSRREDPIHLRRLTLGELAADELHRFFDNRLDLYPDLKNLLDDKLMALLAKRSAGNPLALDIGLQALIETRSPAKMVALLQPEHGIQQLKQELLSTYMNSTSGDRHWLLHWLAVARNGLYVDLIQFVEPKRSQDLQKELQRMEALPFIKVRELTDSSTRRDFTAQGKASRRTYFLHDTMYALCDEKLLRPEEVAVESTRILEWYEQKLKELEARPEANIAPDARHRLLVESLLYQMRADPVAGYAWYLRQSDDAIRNGETGLDMRLKDALGLFLSSAFPARDTAEGDTEESLSSAIDQANVKSLIPQLATDYRLDSATLWIKRYMIRGQHDLAQKVAAKMMSDFEEASRKNPTRYNVPFAEFLLYYGQVTMYAFDIQTAEQLFLRVFDVLQLDSRDLDLSKQLDKRLDGAIDPRRLILVVGRTSNNLGYLHWMYFGKYRLAVDELRRAINLFRKGGSELLEELANSRDNLGRVYVELGYQHESIMMIRQAKDTRQKLGLAYRQALSAASLATAYAAFEDAGQAKAAAEECMYLFHRTGVQRGIGLGRIAEGNTLRNIAELLRSVNSQQALNYVDEAVTGLAEAVDIFGTVVPEPIREVKALNELACCYRTQYLLMLDVSGSKHITSADREFAYAQARKRFREAIDLAKQNHYLIDELDSIQDLAVLLTRARRFDDAEKHLAELRKRIPDEYQMQPDKGLTAIDETQCIDAYYKLMAQIELLQGYIIFKRAELTDGPFHDDKSILDSMERYMLGLAYLYRFSNEAYTRHHIYERMSRRFENTPAALEERIVQDYLPGWIVRYRLPLPLANDLFRDIFGALSPGQST